MKKSNVVLGAVAPQVHIGCPQQNAKEAILAIKTAYQNGINFLCFPELSLSAVTAGDLFFYPDFIKSCRSALDALVALAKDIPVYFTVGLPLETSEGLKNAIALCGNGQIYGFVCKKHLSNIPLTGGMRYFVPHTTKNEIINIAGLRVAVQFFDDLTDSTADCDVLLCPSAATAAPFRAEKAVKRLEDAAALTMFGAAMASPTVGESVTDELYCGIVAVSDNKKQTAASDFCTATIVSAVGSFEVVAISTNDILAQSGANKGSLDDQGSFLKKVATVQEDCKVCDPRYPFICNNIVAQATKIIQIQSEALARRIAHTGAKTVQLGVSGGLDSTLALLVAVDAAKRLGRDPKMVMAVTMPGEGTSGRTYQNAKALMGLLGVTVKEISIVNAFRGHLNDIGHSGTLDVAYENAQARERTQILMDLSNMHAGFVIGTGDLSELALGFCTYNGDHMSMYSVNASVPKTLMRAMLTALADCYSTQAKKVILDIVDTPVSPELLPQSTHNEGQHTEKIIGPYVLHDFFLYHFLTERKMGTELFELAAQVFQSDFTADEIKGWQNVFFRRFVNAQFKRSCAPEGVNATGFSVSPRGGLVLGGDLSATLLQQN